MPSQFLRANAARLRSSVDVAQIDAASVDARQANDLIDRRTFSWTELFNQFEATLLFIGAKIVGTAIVARLFQLTEAQLLRIPWFARAYAVFMPWKNALTAWIHDSWPWRYGRVAKERAHRLVRPLAQAVRTEIMLLIARVKGWLGRT